MLVVRASENERVRIRVGWRIMFFGVFLLTFIPPLHVTHTRIFVQAQSACQLALLDYYLPCFVLRPTSISRPDLCSQSL